VTPEQRNDIVKASLLAQLVAKKKFPEPRTLNEVNAAITQYFDVLSRIVRNQDKGLRPLRREEQDLEAHQAILDVAAVLLAGAPAALALVKPPSGTPENVYRQPVDHAV
jgi:hypothetical protein